MLRTKKNRKFKWGPEEESAFNTLKEMMVQAPVLKVPDFNKQFILHCDAFTYAYGSVLNQINDSYEHPIGFFSKQFCGSQTNYTVARYYEQCKILRTLQDTTNIARYYEHCKILRTLQDTTNSARYYEHCKKLQTL